MNISETINVADEIFQRKSLGEIRTIESKLRSQVREKREDLRQTVGEQYRNVIDSGQNVRDMQSSCANVKSTLESISQRLKKGLHQDSVEIFPYKKEEFEFSQSIVELHSAPSRIWSALAAGKYFQATILFIDSQRIITEFNLADPNSIFLKSLHLSCPILCNHIQIAKSLKSTILSHTVSGLGSRQSPDSLTENLVALQILQAYSSEDVLLDFLRARREALLKVFDLPDRGPPTTTRHQLTEISQLTISTLHDVKSVFFPAKDTSEVLFTSFKSGINFRQKSPVLLDMNELSAKFIHSELKTWVENLRSELVTKIAEILAFVTNAKGLTSIRDFVLESVNHLLIEINQVFVEESSVSISCDFLKLLCLEVLGESRDIWDIFIGNPLLTKMERIISDNCHKVVSQFSSALDESLDKINSIDLEDFANFEINLSNFLWSAKEMHDQKPHSLISQVIGCTPSVLKLCGFLDELFLSSQDEVQSFITTNQNKHQHMFTLPDYETEISHLLRSQCMDAITDITSWISERITELSERYFGMNKNFVDTQPILNSLVYLGRLGVNICENCNTLRSILEPKEPQKWKELKSQLLISTRHAFQPWLDSIATTTSEFLSSSLEASCETSHLPVLSSDWSEVGIVEEREDGVKHETLSNLPTKPSPVLHQTLFAVCQEIHRLMLSDREVLRLLADKLIAKYIGVYKGFIEHFKRECKIPQSYALQLLFDVKFLLSVIPHGDTPSVINRDINTVLVLIEDSIDPFDLDVYKPYIHTSIHTHLQLNSILFGSFTNLPRPILQKHQDLTPQAPHFESKVHNIVPLAPSVSRFILLPVSSAHKDNPLTKLSTPKIEGATSRMNYLANELNFLASCC